jgi:hypothetical protein
MWVRRMRVFAFYGAGRADVGHANDARIHQLMARSSRRRVNAHFDAAGTHGVLYVNAG